MTIFLQLAIQVSNASTTVAATSHKLDCKEREADFRMFCSKRCTELEAALSEACQAEGGDQASIAPQNATDPDKVTMLQSKLKVQHLNLFAASFAICSYHRYLIRLYRKARQAIISSFRSHGWNYSQDWENSTNAFVSIRKSNLKFFCFETARGCSS